jgi:Rps23 Pro-64 3,4-dihydroxylase Tpa1-like proline 4-hydroxylase
MGSAERVQRPKLKAFHQALESALPAVRSISGREITRVDLRSYVYLAGSFLLPHSDCQTAGGRRVAFAYYLHSAGCIGGELELFEARLEGEFPVETRAALTIEPRANRMVLFDVTPASIHQVREVLAGARISLSGWFLA